MKQKLLINQSKVGRWLTVVLALLLMPLGIMARGGEIIVAGTSPDENGDIVDSDIQGFDGDSYVVHYSDGVLTLQNVRLEGQEGMIEWTGDTDLIIEFSGSNSIDKQGYTTDVLTPIKSTTGHNLILRAANNSTNARLYFGCYDLEGTNDLSGVELISGFSQVVATGLITNDDNGTHSKTITYRVPTTSYNLWLGGVQVTSDNASNVLGDDGTPTVVFDAATNTLTLNNLSEESFNANDNPYVVNGLGNLTIHLVGENFVWFASQFLAKSGTDGDNYNVTFTTDEENRGSLGLRSGTSDWCTGHTVVYNNGLAWIDQGYDNDYHTYEMLIGVEEYDLTVSGVQVTSANASNVLGDDETPTIVFDAATNTLTLNEANLTVNEGDAIVSGLDNLTIFLVGENIINSYGNTTYAFSKSSVSEATITFTTDATSNGSLTIGKLEQYLFGDGVTPVYDNVSIKHDGDYHTISSSCGISVGGVAVTEFNKSDVLGNGKVSYNATAHTLTLNNATIAPNDEVAGISFEYDVDLTIALIGNNSIRGGEGCTAISKIYGVETPHLYFVKADANQHFSLNIIAQDEDNLFENFTVSYSEDFFVTDEEDDGTFTRTISSSMFGGTGSSAEPFLIKTADDLKNFAINYNVGRFSNNVHIQLFNDINCEGVEGFTTIADTNNSDATFYGVFDGNNKTISNLTMTGKGLFGYVSKDNDFGVGTIQDLTLSGCHLTSNDYAGGGIVAELSEGAIVSNCTIVNSTIACAANQYNPEQGGIVGRLSGTSTVTGCVVSNVQVKAETTYTGGSGALGIAGGIVGRAAGGTISSCAVRNGSKITCYYADESAELDAGALVGKNSGTTLSGNYYDYDVTVEMLNGTNTENKITKSGYTQRAIGGQVWNEQTQANEPIPDVMDNNGAVMYTKTVTLPGETQLATVTGEENTYYSTTMISDALAYLVAPGQTVTLNANPGDGYIINTFTATNATTSDAITTTPTELGEGEMQYTFAMPDAPVTVAVTTVAAYGIAVAGVEVTELNNTDVLGDGKVSYNATTHTLTLNNANIVSGDEAVGIYYSGSDNLTISLIGSNSINSGACSPIRGGQTPQLIFAKGDNQPCSLRTENTDGWAIDGFSKTNFGGLFKLESQETEDDETTYYMTLTSTILSGGSGTSADPLIIATANDLKNFASYIRESVIPNTSFAKLSDDIGENGLDCSTLEFEPIGYGSTYFLGTFDGNNKTIKNLTVNDNAGDCVGFVRILGEGGVIKDLTLDNLTLSGGNSSSNDIGGLVGILNGSTINNCTIKNSTVSCRKGLQDSPANSQNPTVGGFVGESNGTIVNCTLLNTAVKAETDDTSASGANANAGGIAGNVVGGSISGCQVKGTTTVLASYGEYSASIVAGALFGNYSEATLSDNTYEYTVTATEKVYVDDPEHEIQELQTTNKTGYTQRAIGGKTWNEQEETYEATPDIEDNNGAVMYTQTVTLPEETSQASVVGEENTYYSTTIISDLLAYTVAPGQTVTLNAIPGDGYGITSLTATNTATEAAISTESEELGDHITRYTFTMPDAPVTVALTTVRAIGIRVAGVEVTEVNAANVLGDGKVAYNATTKTLTLNGATINGGVYVYDDLLDSLTVCLQGQNVIDGGYVSDDENGDWAFGTSVENAKLIITTDAANPGQLLIKKCYINEWGNPEYYSGWYPALTAGLIESEVYGDDKKALIAQGAIMTPGVGIYWPDQQYTISGREGVAIKYRDNLGHFDETTYAGAFTMSTVGHYSVNVRQEVTVDETAFTLSADNVYIVHSKPAFSLTSGSYAGTQNITLSNLPANLPIGEEYYPQVWYYKGDNTNDSVRITSAEQAITVSESTKVCVYILDEDSGKVLKSKAVEAEYVILPDIANAVVTGLADSVYTGEAIVPEFTVKASAEAEDNLIEGTDYEVSYKLSETTVESMVNVATYTIVISGIGAYGGTKEVAFNITQATPTITFAQESYSAVLGQAFTSPSTVDSWDVTPTESSNTNVATVSDGVITLAGIGTTTITVTFAGNDNYTGTTASYELVVSRALEVTFVGSNTWASYYATENLALPEGLTAYIVSDVDETSGVVTVAPIGYIPANNGVLLQRADGTGADGFVAAPYTGSTSTFTNLLQGSASEVAVSSLGNNPVYVLYNDKFKRATSGTIPERRAYLPLGAVIAGPGAPQLLTLNVVDEFNTGIGTLAVDDNKGSWYTLDGFKLSGKPQRKGIYIRNGKKVFYNNQK